MNGARSRLPTWALLLLSVVLGFAVTTFGVRLWTTTVTPVIVGLAASGFLLAFFRPRDAWLTALGLGFGIAVSALFPQVTGVDDPARYGNPPPFSFRIFLQIWAIPIGGTVAGVLVRLVANVLRRRPTP
jgi:hypothetical protein